MSIASSNSINLFQQAQQPIERTQKIQIPKIRGNLSSFNDLMSYDSMKIENKALNNLRNMSEDKLDQYLTNLNDNSTTNNPNLGNNSNFQLNCGNSIISNNLYYQNCNPQQIQSQPFSPEKRKSSNLVGWDYDDSTIQEQQNEDGDLITDKQLPNEGSTMLQSQSGSEKQNSATSTVPMTQLGLLKSISKKSSCIQLMSSAADLSEQPTQQQSFSDLNATSPTGFFKKQVNFSKPAIIRSQSPSVHQSGQNKSVSKGRNPSKIIKIRTPSATPLEQNNQSPNEKNSEVSKSNSNNGQIIQNQPSTNNTLYYKKILQNTKILQQRQKALAQFQSTQQQSSSQHLQYNLKTSQSSALYYLSNNSNSVHEKYSPPQRGSISKSTHAGTSDPENKIINPLPIDQQNQENNTNFQKLDFGKVQVPKLSYLNLSKGNRHSKYYSNTENSQLKTEADNSVSPLTNDILSQSTSDFQQAATKYVNYTQKLYKNIQSSIDYLQKQFDNPIEKKQLIETSPKSIPKQNQQHQHNFIKQQYYTIVNKSQLQQVVYPLQQINQSSIIINHNTSNNIIEQPTYKNYQKLSVHKRQAKSVERMTGQSSTISPNQPSPRREQLYYKTNLHNMNATSSANILQTKIINLGGNNILSYCIKNKPLIRSSSQYQKKIDQAIKSHNDSSLSISKPMLKTSDISASLQLQIQHAFLSNEKSENSNNPRLELKPKNSFLKFDPIFVKKI